MTEEAKRGRGRPRGSPNKSPAHAEAKRIGRALVAAGAGASAAAREALTQTGHAAGPDDYAAKLAAAEAPQRAAEARLLAEEFASAVPLDEPHSFHYGPWLPQRIPEEEFPDDGHPDHEPSSLYGSAQGRQALRDSGIDPRGIREGKAKIDGDVNALTKGFGLHRKAIRSEAAEVVARIAADLEARQRDD